MEKVKIETVAAELGISQATARSWLRHGVLPGIADKKEGSGRWHYVVYRSQLDKYKKEVGIT